MKALELAVRLRAVGPGALGSDAELAARGAPGVALVALPLSDRTRSIVMPRAANQAVARRSTAIAVAAVSSSWISAYATRL